MTMHEETISALLSKPVAMAPVPTLADHGYLSFEAEGGLVKFRYQALCAMTSSTPVRLPAPKLDGLEGDVLDPSLNNVIVRIAPYPDMASGDKLSLRWEGLDAEGFAYRYDMTRWVSDGQLGKDVVFEVNGLHIATLDGGSLEVYWTLQGASSPATLVSVRRQVSVGDVATEHLAPFIEGYPSGTLDPERALEGVLVKLQPYARMAAGDRVVLTWHDGAVAMFRDSLKVEAFAVGEVLSFWVPAQAIVGEIGRETTLSYQVVAGSGVISYSGLSKIVFTPTLRGLLDAPDVLESEDGVLQVEDSIDGITVVIGNAQARDGELVYLRCDGEFFNHRDDRDINRETSGQPLVFIVPARFWREHRGTHVRISYSVERNDDTSQLSEVTAIRVE